MTQRDLSQRKPSIALIGMRGSGKSTVGLHLANLLGGTCVDTDELVTQRAGKSIAAIFNDEEEPGFRKLERIAVIEVAASPPAVISVGGGAILDNDNVRDLRAIATMVWLTAPAEVLWERITRDVQTAMTRPPLTADKGVEELRTLLEQRTDRYAEAAEVTIDTADKTPGQVAEIILERLGLNP